MRLFRAKKNSYEPGDVLNGLPSVLKGQVFFVDSQGELPYHYDTMKPEFKEFWQELEIHNHYGTMNLRGKI